MKPRLGIRENDLQFTVLVLINSLVGAMVGMERTVLPLLAHDAFHLDGHTAVLSFVAVFGVSKALANLAAGRLAERWGRRPTLILGWVLALPVAPMLVFAESWSLVLAANVLLGLSQGLAWSSTVIMKIDLAGPQQRGLAMGLNEAAGYIAVAVSALLTGMIAESYGLRPWPLALGGVVALVGLLLSVATAGETRGHADEEARQAQDTTAPLGLGRLLWLGAWGDRPLATLHHTGMLNNLNDGVAWGLFPLLFAARGLDLGQIGMLMALTPAVWGLGQLVTGAWSDRVGRRPFIAGGMAVQSVGIAVVAGLSTLWGAALGAALLGLGTAMVYPTLLAAVGDRSGPTIRASTVGTYRLWRDGGYAVGALLAGIVASQVGMEGAIWSVAGLTLVGAVHAWRGLGPGRLVPLVLPAA